MKSNMILAAGIALALSSCSTIQHTSQVAGVDTNVYNLTVADMNVGKQKQTVTTEWKWNPLSTVTLKSQKETATARLLEEAKADVLVEPQYVVKRRGLFRGGSLTVTGYPATYSNFRTMTAEDAEKLAKISGACGDSVIAFAYPVINTSVSREVRKPRKVRKPAAPLLRRRGPVSHNFVSTLGAPLLDANTDFEHGFSVGLMFGHYGSSWGWYGKAVVSHAEEYIDDYDYKDKTAPAVTVGAIKTMSPNWNCFFGLGFGGVIVKERHSFKVKSSVPVDLGFQWHARHINLLAGATYTAPVYGGTFSGNIIPFMGIGYNF
ncbi:hypothetical protein [Duncaniella muris]|uniref:hypothetical protein n=1 Tax=Duncaniella muris TaxID=2094150 RepID=UPI0025A9D834|nr:hypothetical protein [Duncaniella muris]